MEIENIKIILAIIKFSTEYPTKVGKEMESNDAAKEAATHFLSKIIISPLILFFSIA
jgi:hypothetical protein